MSWIDPRTWAGDAVTSAKMNEIRDSLRASGGPRTTTLPALVDESEWVYPADTTNGVVWQLKYNAGSASAFKWECNGGGYVFSTVATDESTASTTYVDLATVGPSITLPRAGDYEVFWEAAAWNATGGVSMFATIKKNAAATADVDGIAFPQELASAPGGFRSRRIIITGMAAGAVVKIQYKTSAGTGHFLNRGLFIRPVRVS